MLKKLELIVFPLILTLCTLLGCFGSKESNDSAHEGKTPPDKAPQDKTPSLVSITKPLTYSKNQAITPLVLNNTGDPVVRCTIDPDLPNGLEIAADSGSCRITGTLTVTLVQTTFAITGTDAQGQTDTATVSIVVNDETPQKSRPPSLVSITEPLVYFKDQAIIPLVVNNTGDPVVSCVIDPNLPNGLAIAANSGNCQITGTPTVTFPETEFTITATNAEGETDTATVSIVIYEKSPPSLVSITALQYNFKQSQLSLGYGGAPIPLVIANTGDPVIDCTIDPSLPDGMVIAASSGNCQITGTPTVTPAQTKFTITGTDAQGQTGTATVVILFSKLYAPPIYILLEKPFFVLSFQSRKSLLVTYFEDRANDPVIIKNSSKKAPIVTCTIYPDLPNGMVISADSGDCQITGNPTVASLQTEFLVTGIDAKGQTDTATVFITTKISPLFTDITETLAYLKDQTISPQVLNNIGDLVVSCTVNPKLSTGLDIATDGGNCRITGTPTMTLAETAFTITGTDAQGDTNTTTVSIVVREKVDPALSGPGTSILSPTFPLATASDTTITIQTDQDSRISILSGVNCSGKEVASGNVADTTSNVQIILPANSLKNNNTDTDFSNFFTLCQEDKNQSNAVAKITSFMVHNLSIHNSLSNALESPQNPGAAQIGDIWGKVFVSRHRETDSSRFVSPYSHLVARLFGTYTTQSFTVPEIDSAPFPEHFRKLGRSTAHSSTPEGNGTSFYVGKNRYKGKTYYIMATNKHLICRSRCDSFKFIDARKKGTLSILGFPLYEYYFKPSTYYIGFWGDIDFALYAFKLNDHLNLDDHFSKEKRKSIDTNLSNSRLEFDFTSDIYPGQELVTAGYGNRLNPRNAYPFKTSLNLMFNFDEDCKVFSPRNEFDKVSARTFSFAHGCEISDGDSGSPVMDRKTGKIVGIIWGFVEGGVNDSNKNSEYIHTHYMNKKEAFRNLRLAAPAPKIKTYLEDWVTKNDATLGEIQKRLLRKFLDKELD